ncbi:MAG: diguanylate cyclase, partial [Vallitaleaceae bacterium]|nr:diguanylate cyclase [Vallitaleaceae bacterium]
AEEELFQEKELFRTTLQSVGDGVIATDVHGKIQLINAVAQRMTGWKEEDAFGKDFTEVFQLIHDETREIFRGLIDKVLQSGEVVFMEQDMLLVRSDGVEIPIEDSAAPIRNQQQKIIGAVVVFRDFSEKKEKLKEIEYLSFHDYLTGLYNRRYIEDAMKHMDTSRNLPFSIMILDVNGLKMINDSLGHQIGDELIQAVARAMEKACRADDIIARIGGDEFMVLLPRTTQEEAKQIGQRIQFFAKEHTDKRFTVSVAFGCGTKMKLDDELGDAQKKADQQMYVQKEFMKNSGGNHESI